MKIFNVSINNASQTQSYFNKEINVLNDFTINNYIFPEGQDIELTDIINFKVVINNITVDFKCSKISTVEQEEGIQYTYVGTAIDSYGGVRVFIFIQLVTQENTFSVCYLI